MLCDRGRRDLCEDRGAVRGGRHRERAAQLAVDLQHQLDLVLHQRGVVDLRPGRVEQLAELGVVAELLPQRLRDVRAGRVERAQQDAVALAQRGGIGAAAEYFDRRTYYQDAFSQTRKFRYPQFRAFLTWRVS